MTKGKSRKASEPAAKRDIFAEIKEGMVALSASRKGKLTLRTHSVEIKPAPQLSPFSLGC